MITINTFIKASYTLTDSGLYTNTRLYIHIHYLMHKYKQIKKAEKLSEKQKRMTQYTKKNQNITIC